MPPAAASAALDLGLSYHVFCNDAEPSKSVFLQSGDSGTILPKTGRLSLFFPTLFSLDFWLHINPFKCIYDRIHQDNQGSLDSYRDDQNSRNT